MKKLVFVLIMAVMVTGCNRTKINTQVVTGYQCTSASSDGRSKFVLACIESENGTWMDTCDKQAKRVYCQEVMYLVTSQQDCIGCSWYTTSKELYNESDSTSTKP